MPAPIAAALAPRAETLKVYKAFRVCVTLVLALALTACRAASTGTTPPPAVKLAVIADGIYIVPASALLTLGFDLTKVEPADLALTNNGQPVGFTLHGQGQQRTLYFYGEQPSREAYSDRNIYWLSRRPPAAPPPAPIATHPATPTSSRATANVTATVHVEEDRQRYGQGASRADRWVWQTIFAPAELQVMLSAPHAMGGEARLNLRLVGNSSAPVDPDHHLTLALNDMPVADLAWDGQGEQIITATVPAGLLRPGDNTLTIRAPGDTGAPADALLLDWIELDYTRALVLDDALTFAGQAEAFTLYSAEKLTALWDITDPAHPVALSGYSVEAGVVRFASDGTARRFIAATQAGLRRPVAITPASSPDPASTGQRPLDGWPGGADMLIVTVPQFHAALAPLVAARQAQGLRVAVVDVEQIYDSFSYGRPDPDAIRALVRQAHAQWTPPAPRTLLLAGDASYDPRGYLDGSEVDLIPTQEINTAHSGWTASDVWYGLADDSLSAVPVLAVGRFPAQTTEQLTRMVAKTLAYEHGDRGADWRTRALLVADGSEPDFTQAAQAFTQKLNGYTAQVIATAGDGAAARRDLLRAFDEGIGLLGYFGHGSVTLWAKEKVLSVEDVAKLTNRERLPIVFTVTCLSGFFQHPATPSLGETLLRAANGGAVAALVPSSAAVLTDQQLLAQGLANALAAFSGATAPRTLGAVVLQAQGSFPISSQEIREVLLTFNLLGDPELTLAP